ncbi:aminotransferase class V-fold PLP-dependent enzyme [Pontibacter sp. G13]|uniref:aminotransferase class V-fold PLP-dependent enzyme n=1 Tax=Pontibacter sp. G13 TaxID=3074898 RepID=UPI00288AB953|nr:aminotransferase class V-fold PLP-dependent enzyme [Pontibacter sp. G13]WNJ21444.1 aminotransferase class V-fold PLP-dependent enzyme [Pontibacter sp. G13]
MRRFLVSAVGGIAIPFSTTARPVPKRMVSVHGPNWERVRSEYALSDSILNFHNAGLNPTPRRISKRLSELTAQANEVPALSQFRQMPRMVVEVREKMASFLGCKPTELSFQVNTTQALETILLGMDLPEHAEILTSDQDYPSILNTLDLLQRRKNIKVVKVSLPTPTSDDEALIESFRAAITPQTRVLLFSHIININGQILPAKKLCDLAKEHGILSVVDGAHAVGQLPVNLSQIGCDCYATSFHKWVGAPVGNGGMYIREDLIPDIWPNWGAPVGQEHSIEKFEHSGTHPLPIRIALEDALDFHLGIGTENKRSRLLELNKWWIDEVKKLPKVYFNSPLEESHRSSIINVGITGWSPDKLSTYLRKEWKVFTSISMHPQAKGIRVSPNVYTSRQDVETLILGIKQAHQSAPE